MFTSTQGLGLGMVIKTTVTFPRYLTLQKKGVELLYSYETKYFFLHIEVLKNKINFVPLGNNLYHILKTYYIVYIHLIDLVI